MVSPDGRCAACERHRRGQQRADSKNAPWQPAPIPRDQHRIRCRIPPPDPRGSLRTRPRSPGRAKSFVRSSNCRKFMAQYDQSKVKPLRASGRPRRLVAVAHKVHVPKSSRPGRTRASRHFRLRRERESPVGTGQERLRRYRGVRPQHRPHGRGRRQGLAAYLKPREEGHVDDQNAEVTDVVKTFGQVAEYWFADPQRTLELQSSLGKAYLDLWANAVKRMAGEEVDAGGRARAARQALRRSGMVEQPVLRFSQAGLPAHRALGQPSGEGRQGPRSAYPAEGRVLPAPDRQRDRALELRADQSRATARDPELQRRQPGARHAHAGRGHRRPATASSRSASRMPDSSRSAATSR